MTRQGWNQIKSRRQNEPWCVHPRVCASSDLFRLEQQHLHQQHLHLQHQSALKWRALTCDVHSSSMAAVLQWTHWPISAVASSFCMSNDINSFIGCKWKKTKLLTRLFQHILRLCEYKWLSPRSALLVQISLYHKNWASWGNIPSNVSYIFSSFKNIYNRSQLQIHQMCSHSNLHLKDQLNGGVIVCY